MSGITENHVLDEQVRLLYRGAVRSTAMNYAFVPAMALLLYDRGHQLALGFWLLAVLVVTTVRLAAVLKGAPYDRFFEDSPRRHRRFAAGVAAYALTWGAGMAWFVTQLSPLYQSCLFMAILIGIAIAMIAYSTSLLSFFVLQTCLAAPPLLALFAMKQEHAALLGVLTLAGCGLVSVAAVWNYRRLTTSIRLRFERSVLLDTLKQANENLQSSNDQLETLRQQLVRVSLTDELTGIPNRRHFDEVLEKEWRLGQRRGTPLSCLMIDVDYFGKYNERYDRQAGDTCIKRVAQAINFHVRRPADLAARYDGGQFIVLLPETSNAPALMLANRIAQSIALLHITHDASPRGEVTASMGLATVVPDRSSSSGTLVDAVDEALSRARAEGRDRIVNTGALQSQTEATQEQDSKS